jgi:hypothetical protein
LEGLNERFPSLALELVQDKPNIIIITAGTAPTLAARPSRARSQSSSNPSVIPSDPDRRQLARPGGNATIEIQASERLEHAFATAANQRLDGLMILGQPMMYVFRQARADPSHPALRQRATNHLPYPLLPWVRVLFKKRGKGAHMRVT